MLEQILEVSKGIRLSIAVLMTTASLGGCASSLAVPSKVLAEHNLSCCELLNCESKDYDYCRKDEVGYGDGTIREKCSCHDYAKPSSSSSEKKSYDKY